MRKIRPLEACILLFISVYSMFPSYLGIREGGVLFNVPRALTMLIIGLILIEVAANRRTVPRLSRVCRNSAGALLLIVGYLGIRFASALASDDPSISINAAASEIIVSTVFLYMGMYVVRDLDSFDRLIVTVLISAGIICVIGLVEAVMERNLVAAAFPSMEVTDDDYLKMALAEKLRGTYRVQSTFFNPLAFASYLILIMPLGIYCFQSAKTTIAKFLFFTVVALMATDIFHTGSRAALLLLIGIAVVYWTAFSLKLLNTRRHLRRAVGLTNLFFVIAVIVSTAPVAQHLVKGQSQDEQSSSSGRLVQLAKGAQTVLDNPILGVGPRMATKYVGIKDVYGETVDNWYLTVTVESGLAALFCFVGILTVIVLIARRLMLSQPNSKRLRQLSYAVEIGIIAFGLFLLILSLHDETFPYLFLLLGGLMSIRDMLVSTRRHVIRSRGSTRYIAIVPARTSGPVH